MSTLGKLTGTVIALLAFAGLTTISSFALFGDQELIAANQFSTGTIDISVDPASAAVTFAGMMPGDAVTNDVTVTNEPGSGALRYAISASATDDDGLGLKDALHLTIKTADLVPATDPCLRFDGTELYAGDLDSTDGRLVGDAATGAQTGDRELAENGAEILCVRVEFPAEATGPKLAQTTATFTFDAEQTANN